MVLFVTLAFVSCSDDDDNGNVMDPQTQTIADFVADNADYSSLLAALDRAGLVSTLDGTTEFTVFAPNNDLKGLLRVVERLKTVMLRFCSIIHY